jgi:IS5 family transposase
MIDLRHPLAVLGARLPWQEIEASIAHRFARRVKQGKRVEGMDLFGPSTLLVGSGVSKAGRTWSGGICRPRSAPRSRRRWRR